MNSEISGPLSHVPSIAPYIIPDPCFHCKGAQKKEAFCRFLFGRLFFSLFRAFEPITEIENNLLFSKMASPGCCTPESKQTIT